jgi:hypothetical protein
MIIERFTSTAIRMGAEGLYCTQLAAAQLQKYSSGREGPEISKSGTT